MCLWRNEEVIDDFDAIRGSPKSTTGPSTDHSSLSNSGKHLSRFI